MAISFVNSTSGTSGADNASFTITKPSGTTTGDFLVAGVSSCSGTQRTITPPAGWVLADDIFVSGGVDVQLSILTKVAVAGEPSSWSGSYSGTQVVEAISCVTYRGAFGLGDTATNSRGAGTSFTVGPVVNTSASNWRIGIGSYANSESDYIISSTETVQRENAWLDDGSFATEIAQWDSNGTVSASSHSRTISRGSTWSTAASWLAILSSTSTAIPGDLDVDLPLLTMTADSSLSYPMVLDVDLPLPTMTADGIATPPEGPLDVLVVPVMSVEGATDAEGPLEVVVPISVELRGETRKFGIRVVIVERESRLTTPRLGAVD